MNNTDAAVDAVMQQAQVFANSWALIGNRFAGPHPLKDANAEKSKLREMIVALVSAQQATMTSRIHSQVIEAAAAITGRRYCSNHGGEAPAEGGEFIVRGKIRRWVCKNCA